MSRDGSVANARLVPKLVAPRSTRIVRRARVLAAIQRGLRAGVCWIGAPAGYGKTTAIADYLAGRPLRSVWYRVDAGDQDVASFFHYMGQTLGAAAARRLPVFGLEYADQPLDFARRFFRAYFAALHGPLLLVLDDLHDADVPGFRAILTVLLRELPDEISCACISRTLPPDELTDLRFKGRLVVVDQSTLRFSDREARRLVATHVGRSAARVDLSGALSAARGWAAGLVLVAERASAARLHAEVPDAARDGQSAVFAALARQVFDQLSPAEQDVLPKLALLPEVTSRLAAELTGSDTAPALLERLHQRQLLVSRGGGAHPVFHLHDLLREFLEDRLTRHLSARDLLRLRERAAWLLDRERFPDQAIELALKAGAWQLARRLIIARAETLLTQGRRATLIDWCAALPADELGDAWLYYWLGVAHMADDATAEAWLERAWRRFGDKEDADGQCMTAARAVLSKTDSWRTHTGLSAWTRRALAFVDRDLSGLRADDQLVALAGLLRALEFADDYQVDAPAAGRLTEQLLARLAEHRPGEAVTLRLIASQTLIEHAGSTGRADVFEKAVDSVLPDLRAPGASPWALGMWLIGFGAVSGRYFPYARRGFPYASADDALRAAVAIGERESLRGVEFGALYHLQLQLKLRCDFTEFALLVARIGEIADSRSTTQVAVVADCQAALHTLEGRLSDAYRACERIRAAIDAGDEPPIERLPHTITEFQVLLSDGKAAEAAAFLAGVLPQFGGEVRRRIEACVLLALALEARWAAAPDYPVRLRCAIDALCATGWPAALINTPRLLAELCGDALAQEIEADTCRALIRRRALAPPESRPAAWPWPLKVHVLGQLRLERDGQPVELKGKAPTRSLDIVRILAIARDHTASLDELNEWLWPDLDGDQARAACEQALHRLRKLLGGGELLVLREGKLRLAPDRVWVDLDAWEQSVSRALRATDSGRSIDEMERAFRALPGPLLQLEQGASWSLASAERVRGKFVELASAIGRHHESQGDSSRARSFYLRALDLYPTSERCYELLLHGRLSQGDIAGALEDYRRYERILYAAEGVGPSPAIRALMAPILAVAGEPARALDPHIRRRA